MNHKPHSIRIFLLDGIPDGVRTAEIIMSTIESIAFPRSLLSRVKSELNLSRPGVYILIGEDISNPGKMIGYIGESEDVARRLLRHDNSSAKDFWIETIIFTSKDENLTKAHIRYVEAELIAVAKKNPYWIQPNMQAPPSIGKLPIADRVAMDEFVRQARTIAGTLGFNIFKVLDDVDPQNVNAKAPPLASISPIFEIKGDGYQASGIHSNQSGDFIVKSGSVARRDGNPSLPAGSKKLRQELIENGVLKFSENGFVFSSDFSFSSPSGAANVITGSPTNGRVGWKTNDMTTYAEFLMTKNSSAQQVLSVDE